MRGASRRPLSPLPAQHYILPMVKSLDDSDEQPEYAMKQRTVYPDESVTLKTPYAVLCIVLYILTMAALLTAFEVIKPAVFTDEEIPKTQQA